MFAGDAFTAVRSKCRRAARKQVFDLFRPQTGVCLICDGGHAVRLADVALTDRAKPRGRQTCRIRGTFESRRAKRVSKVGNVEKLLEV